MRVSITTLRALVAALAAVVVFISIASSAVAESVAITEWMYKSEDGSSEYFELTNTGTTPVDMTGWSQDDSTGTAGKHPLDAFGIIQPGESVLGSDTTDVGAFRSYWNLPASVKVITYSNDSLGGTDAINLWDNTGTLVDQLTYGSSPSTDGVSGNIALVNLFANNASAAELSFVGDSYGSYQGGTSGSGDIGNPGIYTPYAAPEPSSIVLCAIGLAGLVLVGLRRHRGLRTE